MEYLSAIIALLAALIGIIGNTWAPDEKGIRRITITGWCVLGVAMTACIVSVVQAKQRQDELTLAQMNREQLTILGHVEINRALSYTEDAMFFLYAIYSSQDKRAGATLDWENRGFLLFLSSYPLTNTFMDGEQPWGQYLSNSLLRTHAGLTSAISIYGPYLDAKTIMAVENVRSCEMFHLLLESNRAYSVQSDAKPQTRSFLSLDYYVPLAQAYKELRRLLPSERRDSGGGN
jgi:hypothetical protein